MELIHFISDGISGSVENLNWLMGVGTSILSANIDIILSKKNYSWPEGTK